MLFHLKSFFFQAILEFIVNSGRCKETGGITLWQLMEERKV